MLSCAVQRQNSVLKYSTPIILDFRKVQEMSEEESKVIVEEKEEEAVDDSASMPPPPEKAVEIEKMEEQKLKSKFPGNHRAKFRAKE